MTIFADDCIVSSANFFSEMTKLLLVVRHAQSAGKQSGQRDCDRLLTVQGEQQALTLGKIISGHGLHPDLILSSDAARARQTVELLNQSLLVSDERIQFMNELYEAMMTDWQDHLLGLPDKFGRVLIVGHNPWLSMLAGTLAERMVDLGPCDLIAFEFDCREWKAIFGKKPSILNLDQPS